MNRQYALDLIVKQATRSDLIFPTHMSASVRLQQMLGDPDCHLDEVARLAIAEPLIAARLVAIANSVAFTRFGGKVNNVRAAIAQLGLKTLRSVVAAIFLRQVGSVIANPAIRSRTDALWRHSADVATLAWALARELKAVDPETALFAGVVHEIGGFFLLSRAEEFPILLELGDSDGEAAALGELNASVLRALKVPKTVVEAISILPSITESSDLRSGLGEIVALANDWEECRSPLEPPFRQGIRARGNGIVAGKKVADILQSATFEITSMRDALLA